MEPLTGWQVVMTVVGTVVSIGGTVIGCIIAGLRFFNSRFDDTHRRIDDAKGSANMRFDDFVKRFDDFVKRFEAGREENQKAHDGIVQRVERIDDKLDKVLTRERKGD